MGQASRKGRQKYSMYTNQQKTWANGHKEEQRSYCAGRFLLSSLTVLVLCARKWVMSFENENCAIFLSFHFCRNRVH